MEVDNSIADEASQSQISQSNDSLDTFLSPLSRTTTESTESTRTIRGENMPRRPGPLSHNSSYPQPLTAVDMHTPLGTPSSHTPFTALSPTILPTTTPTRVAMGNIAEEFRASGRLQQSAKRDGQSYGSSPTASPDQKLDLFGIAIQLQSEPGLNGWWKQTTQVLRDVFQAERATLAVPSDSTEIENVPWAQLTSFNVAENDYLSRIVVEADGMEAIVSEPFTQDAPSRDWTREGEKSTDLGSTSTNNTKLSTRPKLESRHSYAGYPPRNAAIRPPLNPTVNNRPKANRLGSQTSVAGSRLTEVGDLGPRRMHRHDSGKSYGVLSDETDLSAAGGVPIVLNAMQPLDIERDPLIVPAGIVKVLNNSSATVLTRKYLNPADPANPSQATRTNAKRSANPQHSSHEQHPHLKAHARQRSSTSIAERDFEANRKDGSFASGQGGDLYEDYEQIPGTPWAQSPAPSPAAMVDPDESPFFSGNDSVKEAFKKHPPNHKYEDGGRIAAIGLDHSNTILQIPLIHPSANLSQPQRTNRLYEDRRSKDHGIGKDFRARGRRRGSLERKKKIPLAILSILAPIVPYPLELIDALNQLSPIFATSFYAARQHSNLHTEVLGLSQQRALSSDGNHLRDDNSTAVRNPRFLTGFGHYNIMREESFSPMSTGSAASSSEYAQSMLFHKPQTPSGSSEEQSFSVAQETAPQNERDRRPRPSPAQERSEGYFPIDLSTEVSQENPVPSRRVSVKGSQQTRRGGTQAKAQILHSHGATFHNTHPSLPTATTTSKVEDDEASEDRDIGSRPFKEPSLSLLRSMIDIGATQQFIAEPDSGKLLWVNSKFQAYRSSTSGQHLDDQLWDNIYPKDRKSFRREWLNTLETGEQLSQQVRLARFDGQYRWFHIKFLPLKDKFGLIQYWSGQAMDIHDLHEAEVKAAKAKEKTASEAKYRAIANSLPVIVFAASIPKGMTFANTQWLSYSGQSLEEASELGFLDYVHPDDLLKCRLPDEILRLSATSTRSANVTNTQRAFALRTESTASSAAESEGTAVPGNFTHKTKSNAPSSAASELPIPNELLASLAKDGVILCAKDDQGNLSITTEMRLKSKEGLYRWHLVQGSYIESVNFGQGEAQWFIACTDISVQKKNEAKIQSTNSALEQMNSTLEAEMQRKMGYLSSMSHEIRTPLNGIIGNLQFLINSGLGESAGEWAHGAQEAAKGMHELINGILDLSKAEAKMLKLDKHWFNPRHLMETIMDLLNAKTTEKKIELCHECAPNVPETIRGDEGRIKQVLLNLAGNAIKFTKIGEVIIRCDIPDELPSGFDQNELRDNEIFVRWTIKDTGIGFSEDDKKLLFKAYSQIKTKSTRDISGTGLGLLLCKTMVNLHGGEISAESAGPAKGASFSFFARFKVKKDGVAQSLTTSSFPSPGTTVTAPEPSFNTLSPGRRTDSPASIAVNSLSHGSPALLSDSSSAPSLKSVSQQRSSVSTTDSSGPDVAMKLTLPPMTGSLSRSELGERRGPPSPVTAEKRAAMKRGSGLFRPSKTGPLSPKSASVSAEAFVSPMHPSQRANSVGLQSDGKRNTAGEIDLERSNFRPPMLSVLVVCPPDATRRITCNRIEYVAPRSTPCNITPEGSVDVAMKLLLGEEPIFFTHIVLRLIEDDVLKQCLKQILDSLRHSQVCVVVVTDQIQEDALKAKLPDLDFDALGRSDRVKILLKPAHAYKLAKIFDPFNENAKMIGDIKEAKRKEEKRQQKEAYSLFKRMLGGKGIRVLAVEDNKLQMNILHNFLAKICELDVVQAWNGQECLDLYLKLGPQHFAVIITDTEMPVLNGLAMCRRIRAEEEQRKWPPVPIVSLSANNITEGWAQASEAGFSHYCGKPVNFRDLGYIILELIDPSIPHKFLRERPLPKALKQRLDSGGGDEDDDDDDEDDDDEEETRNPTNFSLGQ